MLVFQAQKTEFSNSVFIYAPQVGFVRQLADCDQSRLHFLKTKLRG